MEPGRTELTLFGLSRGTCGCLSRLGINDSDGRETAVLNINVLIVLIYDGIKGTRSDS